MSLGLRGLRNPRRLVSLWTLIIGGGGDVTLVLTGRDCRLLDKLFTSSCRLSSWALVEVILPDFDLYLFLDLVLPLSTLGTVHLMHRLARQGQHNKHITVQVPQTMTRKNHNNHVGSPVVFQAKTEWCSMTWKSLELPIWASVPPPPTTVSSTLNVIRTHPNTMNPKIATVVTGSQVTRGIMNPRRQIPIISILRRSMVPVSSH